MRTLYCSVLIFLFFSGYVLSQNQPTNPVGLRKIPAIDVKTTDNKTFNTANISNGGKPIIICFWATWCKPCINELSTIADVYPEWQEETGVKLIAISIDDSKTSGGVGPLVNGKNWDYEIYLDINSDFKRAMNVNMIPHSFIINGKNEIVWQHTTYSQGSEMEMINIIRKVAKGDTIPAEKN